VESSDVMVVEAAMFTQFGVCEATTGLRDVTRELKFRVKSFVERLEETKVRLEQSRQCYQLLDKVSHLHCLNSSCKTLLFSECTVWF